ncbi:MAG: hypothetical protein L0206_02575 [Actinobacteria bacterium]|nr:hypothetical protein [Actinomycetota bacterium]
MTADGAARLWRAESMFRHDRRGALEALEACFRQGEAPDALEGPLDGRLVTGTLGYGLDAVLEGATRLWMPWRGKAFDPEMKEGRNLFVPAAPPFFRVLWPSYQDLQDDRPDAFTAFRFDAGEGESVTDPGLAVLKIDYDHPESPWPIRLILDELVHVGDGQHLGQALMRRSGGFRRVAWFALQAPEGSA